MRLPLPRITLRLLMLAVLVAAVDIAVWRGWQGDIGVAFVTVPMANILLFHAPKVWTDRGSRPFHVGFQVAGWLAVASFGYLGRSHGGAFFWPANSVYPWQNIQNPYLQTGYLLFIDAAIYTPFQVLPAWIGGRIVARTIEYFPSEKSQVASGHQDPIDRLSHDPGSG